MARKHQDTQDVPAQDATTTGEQDTPRTAGHRYLADATTVEVLPDVDAISAALATALAEPSEPTRTYTPWSAPADASAAHAMMLPDKGRGLVAEVAQARKRCETNGVTLADDDARTAASTARAAVLAAIASGAAPADTLVPAQPVEPSPGKRQAVGWHDRTVAKLVTAMRTAGLDADAPGIIAEAATTTGYGTVRASTRPGLAAYQAAQAAQAAAATAAA